MAEEEGVIKTDVPMSTSDRADSEEGVLSDAMYSQHTENKGADITFFDTIDETIEPVPETENIVAEVQKIIELKKEENVISPKEEIVVQHVEITEEVIKTEEITEKEELIGTEEEEESIRSKENEIEIEDDESRSKHSDGQLTTDNEEDEEMDNYSQEQVINGQKYENSIPSFDRPVAAFNGNLEYTISQNVIQNAQTLEDRLRNIRRSIQHLFNQMNVFHERLTESHNFDIEEFASTFLELTSLIDELNGISQEYDDLQDKVTADVLKCLDKYEENANICGGHLQGAKLNKSKQIRDVITSWHRDSGIFVEEEEVAIEVDEDTYSDQEEETSQYYDNCHEYQILAYDAPKLLSNYTHIAELPPPTLPDTYFVTPTALPSFSNENINSNNFNYESDNEILTTELPTDLAPPMMNLQPNNLPNQNEVNQQPRNSTASPSNSAPMISQAQQPSRNFTTPPPMISSNILPSMTIPPPTISLPPQNNTLSQLNILPQPNIASLESKVIFPSFQNIPQMSQNPKPTSVLIPGLNIANTAPLFAQANPIKSMMPEQPVLIPTQLPASTPPGPGASNFGGDNFRKQNPQIAPIINLNLQNMVSKSPASNPPSSSAHIPSLLSIEVPFPIEILKRNQSQAQQQRFNNRSRRSPVVNNTESKDKESQSVKSSLSVKSDEPMDAAESIKDETPDDPITDTPGS
jgi:hypothetical protein